MDSSRAERIIQSLETKSTLKQTIFTNTVSVFEDLKEILHEMSVEINDALTNTRLIKVEYRDRGKFEAQLQVATDMLIFSMHTNVFEFNREHSIFQNKYVKQDPTNSYCGIISIYNFLADSFKYNRMADEGYLIGRIFINHEKQFFVEGKRQKVFCHDTFGTGEITKEKLTEIIQIAIQYS
ncbi:MAG: hypothetical protein RR277_06100, partial [Rikenellaceae bacterium]